MRGRQFITLIGVTAASALPLRALAAATRSRQLRITSCAACKSRECGFLVELQIPNHTFDPVVRSRQSRIG
jgi:hypothetical protein